MSTLDLESLYVGGDGSESRRSLQFLKEGEQCKSLFNCEGDLQCCYPNGEYDTGTCKKECQYGNNNQQSGVGAVCERQSNCKQNLICCLLPNSVLGKC